MGYYDELAIRIGLIEQPRGADDKLLEIVALLPGGESPVDDITNAVEAVAGGHPFLLSTKSSHTSWGADSTLLSIAIDVAVGLGAAGIYDGIKALIKRFPGFGGSEPGRQYSDDEMIDAGKRILYRQTEQHDHEAVSIERNPSESEALVTYRASDGKEIRLRITMYDGVPIGERVYREL